MINFEGSGDWHKTRSFLQKLIHRNEFSDLEAYGQMGVEALANATPVRSGASQNAWYYIITKEGNRPKIEWHNRNLDAQGQPVVILIQYGHGTRGGTYVQGHDFINPAIQPIFQRIADDIWKKVTHE